VNKDLVEMDKQQVLSRLKPLVGNNRQWEAFNSYIDLAIEQHQKVLEQSDDTIMMHRQQGAITALRKLKYLRDEVNGIKKTNGTV
jgi:hypothetical protein|tara:strand:+ start:28 stop:282 length:255 start_codon:yes stop_codon:yes gene_type:complete